MQLNLAELWHSMAWFARGVVFVLAFMSIWSLTIMIRNWWYLRRAQAETRKFAPEFSRFLEEDNLVEAITVADINSAERAVERNMLIITSELKRGLAVLATVGSTSPFVGLLGTTMGVVNAFTGMATSGSGGLAAISAGIAEALITTAFGLLVAIPAVW